MKLNFLKNLFLIQHYLLDNNEWWTHLETFSDAVEQKKHFYVEVKWEVVRIILWEYAEKNLDISENSAFILPTSVSNDGNLKPKVITPHSENGVLEVSKEEFIEFLRNKTKNIILDTLEASPQQSNEKYRERVEEAQREFIAKGRVSQIVLSRIFAATHIFQENNYLTVLLKMLLCLIENARSPQNVFLFHGGTDKETGGIFMGASPEIQVNIEGGNAQMEPIAGTKALWEITNEDDVVNFLEDLKETNELIMVVDETIKKLCRFAYKNDLEITKLNVSKLKLKIVGGVLHTYHDIKVEFNQELNDQQKKHLLELTRDPPTLVGSPHEEASEILKKSEQRTQYGSWIGTSLNGRIHTDVAIRTARIHIDEEANSMSILVRAGAWVVEYSDSQKEADETRRKAWWFFTLMRDGEKLREKQGEVWGFLTSRKVWEALEERNKKYNFDFLNTIEVVEEIKWKKFILIDCGDDFIYTIAQIIQKMGWDITVQEYNADIDFQKTDFLFMWPGPGNINDEDSEKMKKIMRIVENAFERDIKIIGECLGHQAICKHLWYTVELQDSPTQWEEINWSFHYNSLSPTVKENGDWDDYQIIIGEWKLAWRIISILGSKVSSTQAHLDSIATRNGPEKITKLILQEA